MKYILALFGFFAAWALLFLQHNPYSWIFGVGFLCMLSVRAGSAFFSSQSFFVRLWAGFFIVSCGFVILGALSHTVFDLSRFAIVSISAILACVASVISLKDPNCDLGGWDCKNKSQVIANVWLIVSIISAAVIAYVVLTHRTIEPTTTPWQLLPNKFWFAIIVYFTSVCGVFATSSYSSLRQFVWRGIVPGSVCVGLFVGLTAILYPLGFGFDPFIHQATERVIAETGQITPKPLTYIGQYALVVILHGFTEILLIRIDRFLLPFFALFYLFPVIALSLKSFMRDSVSPRAVLFGSLAMCAWPLSYFVMTTPHGMSSLFALLSIFFLFGFTLRQEPVRVFLVALAALASVAIHPLPGLAIAAFALWQIGTQSEWKYSRFVSIVCVSGMALVYPVAFVAQSIFGGNHISFLSASQALQAFRNDFSLPHVPFSFSLFQDFIYMYEMNVWWIFIGAALAGCALLRKDARIRRMCVTGALSVFIGYAIMHAFRFEFLISYEQANFQSRVGELALYFLFPCVAYAIIRFAHHLEGQKRAMQGVFLSCGILILTANVYGSYPRSDVFTRGHGYTLSIHDISAVKKIAQDASTRDYAVLSNQMVSAAALSQFGFAPYYQTKAGLLYRYPTPATHPLYDDYLAMVYKRPSRDIALRAMKTMGVNRVYFALNDYWTNARDVAKEARKTADRVISVDRGRITLFVYDRHLDE